MPRLLHSFKNIRWSLKCFIDESHAPKNISNLALTLGGAEIFNNNLFNEQTDICVVPSEFLTENCSPFGPRTSVLDLVVSPNMLSTFSGTSKPPMCFANSSSNANPSSRPSLPPSICACVAVIKTSMLFVLII